MSDLPDWGAVVSGDTRLAAEGVAPSDGSQSLTVALATTDQTVVILYQSATVKGAEISVAGEPSGFFYMNGDVDIFDGNGLVICPVSGQMDSTLQVTFNNTVTGDHYWVLASSDNNWPTSPIATSVNPTAAPYVYSSTGQTACLTGATTTVLADPPTGLVYLIQSMSISLGVAATAAGEARFVGRTDGNVYGSGMPTAVGTIPQVYWYQGSGPLYVRYGINVFNDTGVSVKANIVYTTVAFQ